MSAIAVAGFWGAARWALGGWPPGFFWLFAIGELVSNKPCVILAAFRWVSGEGQCRDKMQ